MCRRATGRKGLNPSWMLGIKEGSTQIWVFWKRLKGVKTRGKKTGQAVLEGELNDEIRQD